jgi:hypothetical protein
MKFFAIVLLLFLNIIYAQTDQISGHLGVFIFPSTERFNEYGFPQNAFTGYKPASNVGIIQSYFISDKFSLSGSIDFVNTSKPFYRLSILQLGSQIAYYPFEFEKKFTPYLFIMGSINIFNVSQKQHLLTIQPKKPSEGVIIKEDIRNEGFNLVAPIPGTGFGLGFDINLIKKFCIFGQLYENIILTNSSKFIKENFRYHNSNLFILSLQLGIKYKFIQIDE